MIIALLTLVIAGIIKGAIGSGVPVVVVSAAETSEEMSLAMDCGAHGYIPKTLAGDGDPVDVLVLTPHPIVAGSVIKCRAVAVLDTEDESGTDAKLLAVPTDKISNGAYDHLRDLADVPERLKKEIVHFYERYKDLEKGKWVKVANWRDAAAAREEIVKGIAAATK